MVFVLHLPSTIHMATSIECKRIQLWLKKKLEYRLGRADQEA